jgi:hypothetical protein
MYDIDFIVKYKSIELDLKKKFSINTEEELGYTVDDVEKICDELYKHELLSVFRVDNMENNSEKVNEIIENIWIKINTYPDFLQIFNYYKNINTSNMLINSDDMLFISLFSYNTFYSLHKCICDYYKNNMIDKTHLDELLNEIMLIK